MTAPAAAPCTWLRDEGLRLQEGGAADAAAVATHLAGCRTCAALDAEIAQLRVGLGRLPSPPPPTHWQRAVWQRIEAKRAAGKTQAATVTPIESARPPRPWRRWTLALAAPVLAAAAIVIVVRRSTTTAPSERAAATGAADDVVLAYAFEPNPNRPRTRGEVAVGDTIVFSARNLQAALAELRVYRDDGGLVLRCSTAPPCVRSGTDLRARLAIPAIGRYRALIATAPAPLPAPTGVMDDDLAALAHTSGAVWRWAESIDIW
jgi:hypothetical protein